MKVYRYKTKISDKGELMISLNPALFNKEVDVIILQKENKKREDFKAKDFVSKWAGFLKNNDTDKSKFDYLSGKYK